jgi:hypothetical protein
MAQTITQNEVRAQTPTASSEPARPKPNRRRLSREERRALGMKIAAEHERGLAILAAYDREHGQTPQQQ